MSALIHDRYHDVDCLTTSETERVMQFLHFIYEKINRTKTDKRNGRGIFSRLSHFQETLRNNFTLETVDPELKDQLQKSGVKK